MKKILLFLVALTFVSLSYAQAVKMVKVIPTKPSTVVDELRVYGTEPSQISQIQTMNMGLPVGSNNQNRPFQMQTLQADTNDVSQIHSSRDLIINRPSVTFKNIAVGENSVFFTKISSFPTIQAGLLRAKTINGPGATLNGYPTLTLTGDTNGKLSGQNVTVDNTVISSPFASGNEIVKRAIYLYGQPLTGDNAGKQAKQHIFFPWSKITSSTTTAGSVTPSSLSRCNTNGAVCTASRCDICDAGSSDTMCYDIRSKKLSAVYDANGATYTKVGSIKLYCKPHDKFVTQNLQMVLDTSTCEQYVSYAVRYGINGGNIYEEGFSTGSDATITNLNLSNISQSENLADISKGPAEKCFIQCNNNVNGCTSAQAKEYFIFVGENGTPVDLSDFANANFCADAKYTNSDSPRWSEGSGLSCKAKEKIIDIYALRCYENSGKLLRAANTYYQSRKVLCRQYSTVNAEYTATKSSAYGKHYFFPSFVTSLDREYGGVFDEIYREWTSAESLR